MVNSYRMLFISVRVKRSIVCSCPECGIPPRLEIHTRPSGIPTLPQMAMEASRFRNRRLVNQRRGGDG